MRDRITSPQVSNGGRSACRFGRRASRRRGAVTVLVAVMLTLLVGMAALTVDVGHLYVVKAELQRSADVAALAGASAFADDALWASVASEDSEYGDALITAAAVNRAGELAADNPARGVAPILGTEDLLVGRFNFDDPTGALTGGGGPNAIQVWTRFTQDSANGPVANFFGGVFGFARTDVSATAIAAFDDGFAGYTPVVPGVLVPFTIDVNEFTAQMLGGPDDFSYDPGLDAVQGLGDGIREIRLFPYADEGGGDGAGNFGLLNVGAPNQGVPILRGQILNGITPEEIEAEVGTSELSFMDGEGNQVTYAITGDPGMKTTLESSVEARVGDVIGFFLYSTLVEGGSNAVYTIVDLRFGRVVDVHFTGNPANRRLVVQPAVYSDPGVRTSRYAPSSGGLVGRVMLVR